MPARGAQAKTREVSTGNKFPANPAEKDRIVDEFKKLHWHDDCSDFFRGLRSQAAAPRTSREDTRLLLRPRVA